MCRLMAAATGSVFNAYLPIEIVTIKVVCAQNVPTNRFCVCKVCDTKSAAETFVCYENQVIQNNYIVLGRFSRLSRFIR